MNDEDLRRSLQGIEGEDPSTDYVDGLRRRFAEQSATGLAPLADDRDEVLAEPPVGVIGASRSEPADPTQRHRRRRALAAWPLAAAAAVVAGLLLTQIVSTRGTPVDTATTSTAQQIGTAWLDAIVQNDRAGFVALHDPELVADDTLMVYSGDVDVLTPARISELYFDGFDAFQASLVPDGDTVRAQGCETIDDDRVECRYTTSLVGDETYTFTVLAALTIENRRITVIEFTEVATEPENLRSEIQAFLDDEADDEDRACLLLGFNTIGCAEHQSDFLRRYIDYFEQRQQPLDP